LAGLSAGLVVAVCAVAFCPIEKQKTKQPSSECSASFFIVNRFEFRRYCQNNHDSKVD
jgi:hypothetical protein